jgi:hypothetical protein
VGWGRTLTGRGVALFGAHGVLRGRLFIIGVIVLAGFRFLLSRRVSVFADTGFLACFNFLFALVLAFGFAL